jgi:ABC-type amino acid transport substrate-binding protein
LRRRVFWTIARNSLPCPVAYAHKKGDKAFEQALNDFITARKESGELEAMFDKYMTADFIRE